MFISGPPLSSFNRGDDGVKGQDSDTPLKFSLVGKTGMEMQPRERGKQEEVGLWAPESDLRRCLASVREGCIARVHWDWLKLGFEGSVGTNQVKGSQAR